MEFGKAQINEYAEVRVQAGSMLPDMKAAKTQAAMELHKSGLFGDPADPLVRRRVLGMIDMGGLDIVREQDRRDEDDAKQEHRVLVEGGAVHPAQFYEDHPVHVHQHQIFLKSPEFKKLDPAVQLAVIAHTITHFDWLNLPLALGLRAQFGLDVQQLPLAIPPPAAPPGAAPGAPSSGAPPSAPPAGGGAPAPQPQQAPRPA